MKRVAPSGECSSNVKLQHGACAKAISYNIFDPIAKIVWPVAYARGGGRLEATVAPLKCGLKPIMSFIDIAFYNSCNLTVLIVQCLPCVHLVRSTLRSTYVARPRV